MSDFEKALHNMFDCIWDCEIEHPIFQDTVGDLMRAVLEAYKLQMEKEDNFKRTFNLIKEQDDGEMA
jgi:hypothetical protein